MTSTITHNNQNPTIDLKVTITNGYRGYTVNKIFSTFKSFAATEAASIENEQYIKDQINTLL